MSTTTPAAEPVRTHEPGVGDLEVFALPTDEDTLRSVITEVFEGWWSSIRFGPVIQGAVFECRAAAPPTGFGMLDGYLTVDLGSWHFHLCIGEHRGVPGPGVSPDVARVRRCHRAELYRLLHDDAPVSWGLRLFNGAGEQQITVLLPNPFLDDDQAELDEPDWSRLACWDHLRERFLSLGPDPRDRRAPRFTHV